MSSPRRWRYWPQALAPSEVVELKRTRTGAVKHGRHYSLLRCAMLLSERVHVPIEEIVVFYPVRLRASVSRRIRHTRSEKGLEEFKGLTICATDELKFLAIAFRIEDVEAHRTPADAYHVNIRTRAGKRRIEPAPLYTKEESNLGKEIRE